jgi:hypothetical protein
MDRDSDPVYRRIERTEMRLPQQGRRLSLTELALKYKTDKYFGHGYTENVYPQYLDSKRSLPVKLLEIGVYHGSSAHMWLDYFHNKKSKFYFFDRCQKYLDRLPKQNNITTICGDQGIKPDMDTLAGTAASLDIVIDDGSHVTAHIDLTFESLWPVVSSGGLYFIEDLVSCDRRDPKFPKAPAKSFIGKLLPRLITKGKTHISFIHVYRNIMVIGKC